MRLTRRDQLLAGPSHGLVALVIAIGNLAVAQAVRAQTTQPADGTVVEEMACSPRPEQSYEQYREAMAAAYRRQTEAVRSLDSSVQIRADTGRFLFSKAEFSRRATYDGIDCRRIRYMSDGLRVVAYVWKPRVSAGKKLPLVIFNRGGNRERSQLTPWMADGFYDFVSRGFVVIASQYRGVDGGEGREEYGGADVRDVLNLLPVARSLGIVDMHNVFLFGSSRGGMMTYLALKHGLQANAAAVKSGVTDLFGNAEDHPELVAQIYEPLIPGFGSRRADVMEERSAVRWADKIKVPLLIMHGTADGQISARRALEFAKRLQTLGRTYELVMYANDGHGLPLNRIDSDQRVIEWFKKHMR